MPIARPAGLSDEESSDDDYGYFERKPKQKYQQHDHINVLRQNEEKLKETAINGDLEKFKSILNLKNVNVKLDSGWTPLLHACFHGQEEFVKYLLEAGANPNLSADSVSPVMMACSNTSASDTAVYNIVTMLIEKHCILNQGDKYGLTPLMRAASSGRTGLVQLILTKPVNIEMRDEKGWTALFWAIHCNQLDCVKILLSEGANVKLIDRHSRTPLEIAESHGFMEIVDVIKKHLHCDDEKECQDDDDVPDNCDWENYYPDVKKSVPNYSNEVLHLLEGMNCRRLKKKFHECNIDLRTFLLLEDKDLLKLGIEMPYERQRIKTGIRKFHTRSWTLNSVAGLYAEKSKKYTIIECLAVLGSHLQQLYILEATLAYVLRDYNRLRDQLDSEPPDSPVIKQLNDAVKKMITNINNIRKEVNNMKVLHKKIKDESLRPADLIRAKTSYEVAKEYVTKLAIICGMGLLAKSYIRKMFT
ncbi:ankyrin repeat, SAM and basic leucine zipper domain-containing protein 1 isoform X2 [Aricia agestis]|uniref:ankyrin repeat, SAM and basic leucine zipper domain-containing protein 1 isoform X2 n=1 Tax=Aricia agestis TaxID=91739 RepID=UPI001C204BD8|nr:ankyrin repeat, SAM and basic leucine zipper domain-containing protein 1 isoform X2 [Aricia agestis]